MNPHIRTMIPVVNTTAIELTVEIFSISERFFITVEQTFEDNSYVKELTRQLEAQGIHCHDYREKTAPFVPKGGSI